LSQSIKPSTMETNPSKEIVWFQSRGREGKREKGGDSAQVGRKNKKKGVCLSGMVSPSPAAEKGEREIQKRPVVRFKKDNTNEKKMRGERSTGNFKRKLQLKEFGR